MEREQAVVTSNSLLKDVGLIYTGAAATALCAQVSIPLQPVPLTLQTFAVTLCGLTLGARRGALSQVAYVTAGAAGIPVFANLSGGPQVLLGVTGGYLLAFILAAGLIGWLSDRGWSKKIWSAALSLVLGNALILLVGGAWLAIYVGVDQAYWSGVAPFIVGAVIKSVGALVVVPGLWKPQPK